MCPKITDMFPYLCENASVTLSPCAVPGACDVEVLFSPMTTRLQSAIPFVACSQREDWSWKIRQGCGTLYSNIDRNWLEGQIPWM